jgi:thiol-disulfide isomerase/thioredoxin
MRVLLATLMVALVFAVGGCGAPTDPTPNRMAARNGGYPMGPYGYSQGTIIGDLSFIGKQSDTHVDYSTLPMQTFTFDQIRQNSKLILVDGAARWCTPCNRDQPEMLNIDMTYGPKGVTTVEVVVEGSYGVPATENDINRWANQYSLQGIVTIDPSYEMSKYADVTAFPMYMIIRASTMKIEYMQVESLAASPIEPVLDTLLQQ